MVVVPVPTPVTNPVAAFTVAIDVLVLVQVPPSAPLVPNCDVEPVHIVDEPLMLPAFAAGFTVSVNVTGSPVHPFNDGVTVTIVEIGLILLLTAVNPPIFPVPFNPKPIFTELVHE